MSQSLDQNYYGNYCRIKLLKSHNFPKKMKTLVAVACTFDLTDVFVYLLSCSGGGEKLLIDREAALLNGKSKIPTSVRCIVGVKIG